MQSRLNRSSLAVLALVAAKTLEIMWPDAYGNKLSVKESDEGYTVFYKDTPLITAMRCEEEGDKYYHTLVADQYDLFIEEYNRHWDWHPHTREYEFWDIFECLLNHD